MFLADRLRWLWRSSTLRLTLLLSVIFALGMSAAIFAALNFGRDAVLRRVDGSLEGLASSIEIGETYDIDSDAIIRELDDLDDLPRAFTRVARNGGGSIHIDDGFRGSEDWRVLVTKDAEGELILIAVSMDDSEEALDLLEGILWTTAMLVIALTLSIGFVIGLFAQRRVRQIQTTLGQLATGDLQARTGRTRSVDDLDDIARQLDTTAAELERLVAQTRHLSASLAHDLRTPLARLRARLEMLPEGEDRSMALEEATRLSGIFDTIMRVAKIEAAQGSDGFEPVDLGALATEIEEIFGLVVEDAGKALALQLDAPATVQADRDMLIQALANLIQNALVHGGTQITLIADGSRLGVADNGPGVDPAQFAEIIKPMVRLDAARNTEGTGLGLALVRAVADRHGAELELSRHNPQGLKAILNFADL